jgi:hypothetical protein
MSPPARGPRQVDEYDLGVARDVGEMKADIRTIKHDLVGLQQSFTLINDKINNLGNDKARGLGFFAGASFIVTTFGALLIGLAKLILVGGGAGGTHP